MIDKTQLEQLSPANKEAQDFHDYISQGRSGELHPVKVAHVIKLAVDEINSLHSLLQELRAQVEKVVAVPKELTVAPKEPTVKSKPKKVTKKS